jgi:hypothetical protein
MGNSKRPYDALRSGIEQRGGSMKFWDDEVPGVWIVKLDGKKRVFESNENGYPELDRLYVPKPGITKPKSYTDYSQVLIPGAIDKLFAMLR